MDKRRIYQTGRLIGMALGLIAVLVGLNVLIGAYFFRADLTDRQEFTLTQSTISIAQNLKAPVDVEVYFSDNLPSYMLGLERQVRDILSEVASYSDGKMVVDYFDPGTEQSIEKKVIKLGIPSVQLNVYEGDEARIWEAYLGIAFFSADKRVILPVVKDTLNFEYDIASALKKLQPAKSQTIAFLAGHNEHNPSSDYKKFAAELQRSYQVKSVDLDTGRKLSDKISTLVVAGPRLRIPEAHLRAVEQYLMGGGQIIFLVDSYKLMEDRLKTIPLDTGLDELLKSYGVVVQKNLIRDRLAASSSFTTRYTTFGAPYPFWPKIIARYMDAKHPAMTLITSFVLPWSSALEIHRHDKVNARILATSSAFSLLKTGERINLEPIKKFNPHQTRKPEKEMKSYPVVALLDGVFNGYYDKSLTSPQTRIVVAGCSEFLTDNILTQFPGNARFLLNLIDWMNLGDDLIEIRSRTIIDRPLIELSPASKKWIKYANIFGIPLLLITFGMVRYFIVSQSRRAGPAG